MALKNPQTNPLKYVIDPAGPITIDGCDTLPRLFWNRVRTRPGKVALREKDFGIWNEYTWQDWGEQACLAGLGLKALGLQRGEVCSIAAEICLEWMFADLGIICAGGVVNGVYPTDAASQVEYLVNDSQTRFYFAEDEEQLDKILEVRERTPQLHKIIIFDMKGLHNFQDPQCISFASLLELGRDYRAQYPDVWLKEIEAAKPGDLMILTYTSGTTGKPKGAMITHRNVLFQATAIQNTLGLREDEQQLSFLPLAHIAGRMFYTFCLIESCSTVNIVESLETVTQDQQQVEPTFHFSVPRVWEKQYSTIAIRMKEASALGRLAYRLCLSLGQRHAESSTEGKRLPWHLRLPWWFAHHYVLRNVRQWLGINRARILSTGAAPIAPELISWFWALGKPMYEVYGQTECCGLATCNVPGAVRFGSVGRAVPGAEIKISAEGEILIRSPGNVLGYLNKPEKTDETFVDGWLRTGDVGRIDEDGFVFVQDRLKDIIITAGGKNITPSEIENQLKFSPYISDAVVVGDRRPYLTCLVMIDQENVTHYAQDLEVPFTNYASLCHAPEVQDLVWAEIEKVNIHFSRVENIKKCRLIDQLLDPEDEELTPTMKLKRRIVNTKYASLIESMYHESH